MLTSLWEGLPRVIPQALAMQVPIVVNQVDCAAEAIISGETGFLCAPGDLDCLAHGCLKLLQDEPRRREISRRSREHTTRECGLNYRME